MWWWMAQPGAAGRSAHKYVFSLNSHFKEYKKKNGNTRNDSMFLLYKSKESDLRLKKT